jgi:hypothetical protein
MLPARIAVVSNGDIFPLVRNRRRPFRLCVMVALRLAFIVRRFADI